MNTSKSNASRKVAPTQERKIIDVSQSDLRGLISLQSKIRGRLWRMRYDNFCSSTGIHAGNGDSISYTAEFFFWWNAAMQGALVYLLFWAFFTVEKTTPEILTQECADFYSGPAVAKKGFVGLSSDAQFPPNVTCSAEIVAQQSMERIEGGKQFSSPIQNYPHFSGLGRQVVIGFHGSLGSIIFLLTPFAVNDAFVRTKLLRSMARSEEKLFARFGKWGPKLANIHHYLLAIQMTTGVIAAAPPWFKRGLTMYKWYAIGPGFSLPLYLQFMALGSLGFASLSQFIFLRFYGLNCPSRRRWQMSGLALSNGVTLVLCILCVIAYFLYVFPFDPQVAYLIVFCVQVPIIFVFAVKAQEYWNAPTLSERLYQWQEMMNRCCWISLFISISTFLANVALRIQFQLAAAIVYLICNVVLIYSSWWMQHVRVVERGKKDIGSLSAIDYHISEGIGKIDNHISEGVSKIRRISATK